MDAIDFDVCGWSGGVLARFGIRDGRLCQWSQHTCSQPGATPQLAATPAGWRASRSATLNSPPLFAERSA
jgi:hypothetical protein